MRIYKIKGIMDGLILKINDTFLQQLIDKGQQISNIKIKIIPYISGRSSTISFSTIESYTAWTSNIVNNNYLDSFGDFAIIQNLEITNTNLYFANSYKWYDIMNEKKLIVSIMYDNVRNSFQTSETERYKSLHLESINEYISHLNDAMQSRLDMYVIPGYVIPGYTKNSNTNTNPTDYIMPDYVTSGYVQ